MINIKSKNQEYEQFNKLANDWWDENGKFKVLHQIRPLRIEYILENIESNTLHGLDVLDVGCGGGLISESLARLGANVTGIDFVENNIKTAKKHSQKNKLKINYICSDIEDYKFSKKYDFIILFEVLEHLENWQDFISKIKSNLKNNGKMIISTINRNILSKIATIYIGERILKWIPEGTHDFNKYIKPEEIEEYILEKRLKFEKLKGYLFNPIDATWYLSKNTSINYFCTIKN
tara:strand:- start:463 stop:1164 length:702 start_codon:yes stop_codon:yes gene_type:complete